MLATSSFLSTVLSQMQLLLRSNESYAGRGEPYSRMDYGKFSPYTQDGTLITPLITDEFAAPKGSADKFVQAYNFRLCTTQNKRCASSTR